MPFPPHPFYFIRHGETDWNRQGTYMGKTDIPLNDLGRRQAAHAALTLKNEPITHIVTSPLLRAHETATIIAEVIQKPVHIVEDLHEFNLGEAGKQSLDLGFFERWLAGETPEGAESVEELDARILGAVTQALTFPGPVLIVSHGGVYHSLRRLLKGESPGFVKNCTVFHHAPHPSSSWLFEEIGDTPLSEAGI